MKAALLKQIDVLEYTEVETPKIEDTDLLIKVKAAAICGTDLRIYHGKKTKGIRFPSVIGHEFSGEVVEVGKKVSAFSTGDRVCVDPVLPCGGCFYCLNEMENVCQNREALGYEYDGCFAEYIRIPGKFVERGNVQRLPDGMPWESGALAEPLSCVINGQRKLNIKIGDTVVVIGAGPIGIMHLMLAKSSGATTVFVSEPNAIRRAGGSEIRSRHSRRSGKRILGRSCSKSNQLVGCRCHNLGNRKSRIVDDALKLARKGARISFFAGFSKGDAPPIDVNLIHYNELVIVGASSLQRRDLKTALSLIEKGSVPVAGLVTDSFPLKAINEAFLKAESGDAIKVVVKP